MQIVSGDLWAGAEAMGYQLVSGLSNQKDIDLFVLLLNKGKLFEKCNSEGINTYLIEERKNSLLDILYKAIKLSIRIKPDIIHSHRYKENIIASIIQPFCGKPVLISTQHGRKETDGKTSLLHYLIGAANDLCLNWRFRCIVAVSNDTKNYLLSQYRMLKKKIKSIHNGVDDNFYNIKKKKSKSAEIKIGSAGRFFPVKNFSLMVDIANQVCKYRKKTDFLLAGKGPEKDVINNKIIDYNIESRFKLLGHVDNMERFYHDIDIYINTSLHEGSPMTILEAMACGKPILAFHQAGLKEIITDGFDGFTIPAGDTNLFVSKIFTLIDNPDLISQMGYNARKKIENKFTSQGMVKEYMDLYKKMMRR